MTNKLLKIESINTLRDISSAQWNSLSPIDSPFLSYEFLYALENCGCVGAQYGWFPNYFIAHGNTAIQAAIPAYIKNNAYGEFVFDDHWTQAYEATTGNAYYPKLISAIPYTPVSGERLLGNQNTAKSQLIDQMIKTAQTHKLSSVHWLFHSVADKHLLEQKACISRLGCQYHWHNANYSSFDDFLGMLSSKKRKMIRRERRIVREQNIHCEIFNGATVPPRWWTIITDFYREIYTRKWGVPTFNESFFRTIATASPEQIVVVVALRHKEPVACAICYQDSQTLYGRHWGCSSNYAQLHFETCYYAGIEYCIDQGLQRFEPGAQGEHKIWRGFLPTPTWSSHWINHSDFTEIVREHCRRETIAIEQQMKELFEFFSPYRDNCIPPTQQIPDCEHSVA